MPQAHVALEVEQHQHLNARRLELERASQRLLSYELRSLLHRWGQFVESTEDRTGLPSAAAFTRIPGTRAGHRILCADMPRKVFFINYAILRLEKMHQAYLQAWYAWTRDEYGHWLDQRQKAEELGINYAEFGARVYRSRMRLLKLRNFWAI